MIKLIAIGHLGKDAVINNVNGKSVINFSVAHSEKYKDQSGQDINKTTWVECAYWVEKTTIAQYLKKGTQVYVEGMPSADYYNGDNGTIAKLRLRVFSVQLLGGNQQSDNQITHDAAPAYNKQSVHAETSFVDEQTDLPF